MAGPKLDHVALTVSDRAVSAEFYGRHFGLTKRVHEDEHLLILADDHGGLLALSEGSPDGPTLRTTHFGMSVESADAVRALRERLRDAGVVEAEWQASGPTRVQVFDPDGYRVEVYGW